LPKGEVYGAGMNVLPSRLSGQGSRWRDDRNGSSVRQSSSLTGCRASAHRPPPHAPPEHIYNSSAHAGASSSHAGTPIYCSSRGRPLHQSAEATADARTVDHCNPSARDRCRDRLHDHTHRAASILHSPAPILTRVSYSRGFLPWALSDACPSSRVSTGCGSPRGSRQTTLNRRSPSRIARQYPESSH
jgi:hypothetical protein